MNSTTYRPQKRAFFVTYFLSPSLLLLLSVGLIIIFLSAWSHIVITSFLMITALIAISLNYFRTAALHRKRQYTWTSHELHYRSGGLFSDRETDLKYPHITHVRLVKPFIRYRLFGTGHILIEAAGSSGTEVIMEAIEDPDQVYADIQRILARGTFRLTYSHKLSEERPAPMAVALELAGAAAGTFFGFLFLLGAGEIGVVFDVLPLLAVVAIVLVVGIIGSWILFVSYQDLTRRTYYIYSDVICYTRGFLTQQEAFMPVENLSDAELHQSFLDKLLGLYDVVISCQGSGSQIHFKNLRNGKQTEALVDDIINTDPLADQAQQPDAVVTDAASTEGAMPLQTAESQQTFYRDATRTLIPYVPLLFVVWIFPPLLIFPLWSYVTLKRTEYRVGARSVGSYFNFLTTKHIEFSQEKITGVLLRRSILDRYLGTCQIDFWSIGSQQAIRFQHVPYSDVIEKIVRDKAGITPDQEMLSVRPAFNARTFLAAHIYASIIFFLIFVSSAIASVFLLPLVIIPIVLGGTLTLTWFILHRRYKRAYIRIGKEGLYMRIGWIFQREYFVKNDNVKDIKSVRYPFSSAGTLQFNIAGEQVQSSGNSGSPQRVPYHFSLAYIQGEHGILHIHDSILDPILANTPPEKASTPQKASADEISTQPAKANDLSVIVLMHMLAFPLLLVLPLSVLGRVIWLRYVSYTIQSQRVVARSGIVYRTQTTIVFSRIDYIKQSQGLLNKTWRNGTIYIYTTGSSTAELIIKNSPDYQEFNAQLKQRYAS